ncbi:MULTISPECIES: hypothetical protein [unclassified Yoonia]|uniref:hypothetical protein n=1 Tax=unclassified Yoonia TaxID=2629118 RepID=UPI002AFFBFDB|nr:MULTISPECIES: hypothetical protein [unclassified Yoonia]
MEYLINRLTFTATPAANRLRSFVTAIMATLDRLEAAIGVAHAHKSGTTPRPADMQTLGLRDQ